MSEEIKILDSVGVTKNSILNKEHNLWIGVSFSNKWHSEDNLSRLIKFGAKYTKDSLLIWIPGRMQGTNFKYFDNLSRADALKKAFDEEEEKIKELRKIINKFDDKVKNKIVFANFDETFTSHYIKQREILFREFAEKGLFYNDIMKIAQEGLESRKRTISADRAESIALYTIHELPLLLDGVKKIDSNTLYNVILYPGLGTVDDLTMKIRNNDEFEYLRQKLDIQNIIGIASVE